MNDIQQDFLGWQCRIRQIAMRETGGKPSSGMQPTLFLDDDGNSTNQITVLIVRKDARYDAAQLRHIFFRTQDPSVRYEAAIKFLSAGYYQHPHEFSDEITALFQASMLLPTTLKARGDCVLDFFQFSAFYRCRCSVRELHAHEPAYQVTYWHNSLFNRRMPSDVRILGFRLDWESCEIRHRHK
ncbi:MAG: hypothetical protein CL398_03615 [Acidiferrobacteraceae bacterium]|nr:hypothetical protein [Acidiferrobacteraceae bacterium]